MKKELKVLDVKVIDRQRPMDDLNDEKKRDGKKRICSKKLC